MARTVIAVLAFIAAPAFAAPFAMITDLKGQAWAMRSVKTTFTVVGPDKTAVLDRTPEFEWTAVPGAKGYRLVVYGQDNDIIHEATTEEHSLRPALELESGKRYRWKVDALGVAKPV